MLHFFPDVECRRLFFKGILACTDAVQSLGQCVDAFLPGGAVVEHRDVWDWGGHQFAPAEVAVMFYLAGRPSLLLSKSPDSNRISSFISCRPKSHETTGEGSLEQRHRQVPALQPIALRTNLIELEVSDQPLSLCTKTSAPIRQGHDSGIPPSMTLPLHQRDTCLD